MYIEFDEYEDNMYYEDFDLLEYDDEEFLDVTCSACFGTGLDRELDADCLVCWGEGRF